MGDAEALRQGDRLGEEAGLAVVPGDVGCGRADHQPAGAAIERLAARRLELGPERVRAHRQRHERRAFADREPGDAGQAMARALVVRRREAVDADDLRAAGGEVVADARCRPRRGRRRSRPGWRRSCGAIVRIRASARRPSAWASLERRGMRAALPSPHEVIDSRRRMVTWTGASPFLLAGACASKRPSPPRSRRRWRRPGACAPRSTSATRSSPGATRPAAKRSASRSTWPAASPRSSASAWCC